MTPRSIARRYATALFDVVRKTGAIDRAERDLTAFGALVAGNAELRDVLGAVNVAPLKKRAVVDALFAAGGESLAEVRRLALLLAERDRLGLLPDVVEAFAARVMQEKKILPAEVVTATALGDGPRHALAEALGKAAGGDVRMTVRVDPSILGGVIARVGSTVFDGSVTHHVERMRQRLLES